MDQGVLGCHAHQASPIEIFQLLDIHVKHVVEEHQVVLVQALVVRVVSGMPAHGLNARDVSACPSEIVLPFLATLVHVDQMSLAVIAAGRPEVKRYCGAVFLVVRGLDVLGETSLVQPYIIDIACRAIFSLLGVAHVWIRGGLTGVEVEILEIDDVGLLITVAHVFHLRKEAVLVDELVSSVVVYDVHQVSREHFLQRGFPRGNDYLIIICACRVLFL